MPSQPTQLGPTPESTHHLKNRIISAINKLSDRDTLTVATNELKSIAQNLNHNTFSTFISCIHTTHYSSSKSHVQKQCLHLLVFLSHFHGNALSPFVSKMVSVVVTRLRDRDSGVRGVCVEAVAAMAARITRPEFSTAFLRPLMEVLVKEMEGQSQMGAALCLAAAVEAAPEVDVEVLRKVALPRLGKFVKNEVCKAKAAVLILIGSMVGVGGACSHALLKWLVPCLVEFVSNEDWMIRKAASEALGKVALIERDLALQHKVLCLNTLQNRRFDKIKLVRETVNRALELWKNVTDLTEEDDSPPAKPACYSAGPYNGDEQCSTKSSVDSSLKSSQPKKIIKRKSFKKRNNKNLNSRISHELNHELSDRKFETPDSNSFLLNMDREDDIKRYDLEVSKPCLRQNCENSKTEMRKKSDIEVHKFGGDLRASSRVVPISEDEYITDLEVTLDNNVNEACENPQEVENLSLIREQLSQIELQQSNLLNLLQQFIGSSQSGMNSLETRVQGLEMALDGISHDLAVSRGRHSKTNNAEDMCCKLPGSEFVSYKFWKKTDGRCSSPRLHAMTKFSPDAVHDRHGSGSVEMFTTKNNGFRHHMVGLYVNPLAHVSSDSKDAISVAASRN